MTGRAAAIALVCAALCGLVLVVEAPSRGSRYTENILVVNADGTGRRNLTRKASPARRMLRAIAPDGRTLAYDRRGVGGGLWSVGLLTVRGGTERTLVRFATSNAYASAWSPDGTLIAFEMCCAPSAIGTVRPDGTGLSLTNGVSNPRWLPGPRLAFLDPSDIPQAIATSNPDGADRRTVLAARPFEEFASLEPSPNGRKFAFTSNSDESSWLSTVGISGLPLVQVSDDAWDYSWSPTSRRLVFVTRRGLTTSLSDGSGQRRYKATRNLGPGPPAWSPDGTRIAFVASYRLVVMSVRHGSLRVVARKADRQKPLWSPDGRRLYYVAAAGG